MHLTVSSDFSDGVISELFGFYVGFLRSREVAIVVLKVQLFIGRHDED